MTNFAKCLAVILLLQTCSSNHTETLSQQREKRWLTFIPNGGTSKIILGCAWPVHFHHKLARRLNMGMNLQANYRLPSTIVWPVPTSIFQNRLNNDYVDNSRIQLYQLLERMFDSYGTNGHECVLRTICEVAETPLHDSGVFGELMDVIFTPYKSEQLNQSYYDARLHGLNGTDCVELYKRCPLGSGLLEKMSILYSSFS
ncbi:uncharacterized protein LOC134216818 [Armigeres subalbatus]|uniref:uncharacterized protein LOC134216818 n=1 Tax=Armigeres subalbatus TaxID=124917 RepID=UPI002ED25FA4